jgi:metallothiol transferase
MASKAKSAVKAAITTTAIDHVVLHVSDLKRSVEFYTGVLGMSVRHGGTGWAFLRCGDQVIGLFEADPGETVNTGIEMNHMAFNQSTGGYAEVKAILDAHGIAVRGRRGDPRCIYFDDPDGHTLQLNVR